MLVVFRHAGAAPDPPSEADPHAAHHHHAEHAPGLLGIADTRYGSGTAWQPDATPMHGMHFMKGPWTIMAHANVFAGYDHAGSDRGGSKWFSTNWGMLMEERALGGGQVILRQMLTLEPLTVTGKGYPLLFQTGEAFEGQPLHDYQHPHDLFMELGALYTRAVSKSLAFQLYAAPVGEPALGPVAFPHRASAASDPLAPLGHHWQDSTHVSFGVLTAGIMTRAFKLEGSWFNGREPDEHRYDFDFRPLDSYSARFSWNPSQSWSFQVSYGDLESPEELHPDVSMRRVTASASYVAARPSGTLTASAVVGRNTPTGEPETSAWLLEADYERGRSTFFGRAEHVRKTGEDLVLPAPLDEQTFPITNLAGGYVFRIASLGQFLLGVGARASIGFAGDELEPVYGTTRPVGVVGFLRLYSAAAGGPSSHL